MGENAVEIKVLTEFADGERMEPVDVYPSGKQVGLAPPEFPRARPREQEPETGRPLVHRDLNGIEQRGNPLHFVEEDGPNALRGRVQLPFESFGMPHIVAEDVRAGEVEREVGTERGKESGLAHLPGPQEQDAAPTPTENAAQTPFVHAGILAAFLPTTTGDCSRSVAWRPGTVLSAVAGCRTRAAGG